jgi:hypothetical protein
MGVDVSNNYFVGEEERYSEIYHAAFVETYMSGLKNYHAYGAVEDNKIVTALGFYESPDDASWYWSVIRSNGGGPNATKAILDKVLEHNESNGRFKFYSMFPKKYIDTYRRFAFSEDASRRYGYYDEYMVGAKNVCKFNLAWQILYRRTLLPVETVVRCTYLKQEYRVELYNAGRL